MFVEILFEDLTKEILGINTFVPILNFFPDVIQECFQSHLIVVAFDFSSRLMTALSRFTGRDNLGVGPV
jgi:hypothetical protein